MEASQVAILEKEETERVSMEASQVNLKVVDRVLEVLNEAFSWVKTQVEAFFKLLWNKLTTALQCAKSFVINCCEKIKQVLVGTNDLIDVEIQKLSETKSGQEKLKSPEDQDKLKNPEEVLLLDELKKMIQKMSTFGGYLTENADPEWKLKGKNLKELLDLAEGFIELFYLGLKQPVIFLLTLLDGYGIHRNNVTKPVSNASKSLNHKGKAANAVAAVLGHLKIY